MRRFYISIFLVVMMIILAVGCYFYTQNVAESVSEKLYAVQEAFEKGDRNRVRLMSDAACTEWKDYCRCQVIITDNNAVTEITSALTHMEAMLENGDDGFINECLAAISLTELYRRQQSLDLCNIF